MPTLAPQGQNGGAFPYVFPAIRNGFGAITTRHQSTYPWQGWDPNPANVVAAIYLPPGSAPLTRVVFTPLGFGDYQTAYYAHLTVSHGLCTADDVAALVLKCNSGSNSGHFPIADFAPYESRGQVIDWHGAFPLQTPKPQYNSADIPFPLPIARKDEGTLIIAQAYDDAMLTLVAAASATHPACGGPQTREDALFGAWR